MRRYSKVCARPANRMPGNIGTMAGSISWRSCSPIELSASVTRKVRTERKAASVAAVTGISVIPSCTASLWPAAPGRTGGCVADASAGRPGIRLGEVGDQCRGFQARPGGWILSTAPATKQPGFNRLPPRQHAVDRWQRTAPPDKHPGARARQGRIVPGGTGLRGFWRAKRHRPHRRGMDPWESRG